MEFGAGVPITYVMGGLARQYDGEAERLRLLEHWLGWAGRTEMPMDPMLWSEAPIGSTYPVCMAVKAAAEQGPEAAGRYLRVAREGLMCFRRKLDTTEALVEEARRAGLDVPRFRVDLASNAIVEAFAADLEASRSVPPGARERDGVTEAAGGERVVFPTLRFSGDGGEHWAFGDGGYEEWRQAALAAGGSPTGEPVPDVLGALRRFGRLATAEVEAVCDLPGPRAAAELWGLAARWRARPVRVLTGTLWELAG
jgi:hypothetical protein